MKGNAGSYGKLVHPTEHLAAICSEATETLGTAEMLLALEVKVV